MIGVSPPVIDGARQCDRAHDGRDNRKTIRPVRRCPVTTHQAGDRIKLADIGIPPEVAACRAVRERTHAYDLSLTSKNTSQHREISGA
jgi:hypothetical protein